MLILPTPSRKEESREVETMIVFERILLEFWVRGLIWEVQDEGEKIEDIE